MSTMYGADVAQLRALAAHFDRAADQLDRGRLAVGDGIRISAWIGPFATSFRLRWDSEHSLRLASAARLLRDNAHRARANAEEQERASAADTAYGARLRTSGPVTIPPAGTSAEDVRSWWTSLTPEQQQRLIERDHDRIGNLNGVPLASRAEANRLTAQARLDEVGRRLEEMGDEPPEVNPLSVLLPALHQLQMLQRETWIAEREALLAERGYLEAVTDGRKSLVVYDPGAERIVEMIGSPGPNTRNVITYVPGTDTTMGSFHSGGVQQVSAYLASDRTGGTVAFVYKDGPWSAWASVERSNLNMEFAMKEGRQLADFQEAIALEPELANARTTGIGHSAGMTILSASEADGAHYDKEISLAGAMLAPGWERDSKTDYYHYQYGLDAINYANPIGDFPAESSTFQERVFDPEVHSFFGIPYQNEFDNHVRIAEGVARNRAALHQMYLDINSD